MKTRLWITYDLGIKGDYTGLYRWLDNHGAKEVGNNTATIEYDADSLEDDVLCGEIKSDLESSVETDRNTRIYVIRNTSKNSADTPSMRGGFLIGRRKSNPWEGYGDVAVDEDDI